MRKLILLIALLSMGCASIRFTSDPLRGFPSNLYRITEKLDRVKQCTRQVGFRIPGSLPSYLKTDIRAGIKYWNKVAGRELFIEQAKFFTDFEIVDNSEVSIMALGVTRLIFSNKNGCIKKATVRIPNKSLHLPKMVRQNIIRHELGHVLGFDHSWSRKDLMFHQSKTRYVKEFKKLSLWEIEAFNIEYH